MIRNYFKIAWRSLWKNKFYSIINITGLAVGLATGMMLLMWVQNELSYDRFHKDHERIVTQSTARKLFGTDNAVGKTIGFYGTFFTITGVLQDFPENSSIRYDALLPMGFYAQQFTAGGGNGDWKTIDEDLGNYAFNTYVKLQPDADPVQTGKAFTAAYKKARNGDSDASFHLQNLADIHLTSSDGNNAALRMVQIFMLVVILLLAIASINYVNLSTARSFVRAKEVSIRKIVGAQKRQLFLQFTIETIVLFCFATFASIVLLVLLMPLYNTVSGKTLSFNLEDLRVWEAATMAVLGTLIASGIYPTILLSSFKPVASLKGKLTAGIGIASFRKGLVVFQFAISVILLVCTIIMSKQIDFIKSKDLGYNKSYVFSVPLSQEVIEHVDAVKTELKARPGILNVAAANIDNLSNISSSTSDIDWKGKPKNSNMIITAASIDKEFIPTMKMYFIEGENFLGTPADSSRFILNETAVKQMGLKKPYLGKELTLWSRKGTISGVVKDFHFQSLKEKISPFIFFSTWTKNILYVRTTAGNAQVAIAAVEKQYKKYAGNIPFSYNFLDKNFEEQYLSDQRAGTLFNAFAGIAIFISCLGLFGLATYTAQVKTKEIGIRKTLGASVGSIVKLISKDFLKLVIIAIIIAIPIAWYAINKWLRDFEYRTNISWWVFAFAGIVALLIALLTVSFQAIKAALANPVKNLRSE